MLDNTQPQHTGAPITCPHCGAPVRYAQTDPVAPPAEGMPVDGAAVPPDASAAPPEAAPPAAAPQDGMEEGGGDADGLENLDDKEHEMSETNSDASTEGVLEVTAMSDAASETAAAVEAAEQPQDPSVAAKEVDRLQAEIRRLSAANASLEQQVAMKESAAKADKVEALFARGLKEGKLTPKMIGSDDSPTETRRFAFRDPDAFDKWLSNEAQPIVEFGERGSADASERDSSAGLAMTVHERAVAMREQDKTLDYATATRRVLATDRALSERYDAAMSGAGPQQVSVVSRESGVRNAAQK